MPLLATPAFWYFVISTYITYEMTMAQARAQRDQAEAQNEMAEENARLQNEMQEKAQDQNIDKAKQLNLAEEMEREKLAEHKLQQDISFREAYGTNVAQLGDYSMTGNTVDRIFGTIDRKLSENKLGIDRDIEALGSNFGFARKNLQTSTDMGVLGSEMNINAFKTGEHMYMDRDSGWLNIGAGWTQTTADSYRLDRSFGDKHSYGKQKGWYS